MILNPLLASPGRIHSTPQVFSKPALVPAREAGTDRADLSGAGSSISALRPGLSEQREADAIIASMVKGDAHDVQENLPFLSRTLYQGLGLQTLREIKNYGLTIQLASSIPTEGAPGWDLLGAYDPRQQVVHLSPKVLKQHSEERAAQVVIHETLHGVDDCRLHQGLEGKALEKQQALESKATSNKVFYASERDSVVKTLQSRFETRVEMAAVAVNLLSEMEDGQTSTRATDRSGRYELQKLDDGRWQLTHKYATAPADGVMKMRGKLHALALGMSGLPGMAALARKTAPLEEDKETIRLADGRGVEFSHGKHGCSMVLPEKFGYSDWHDINFSNYAYKSGMTREYYAEAGGQFLSDAQSRAHIERVDPAMAGWLVAQFPGRPV